MNELALLEAALGYLGHAVWIYTNNTKQDPINPTDNEGSNFKNDTFTMNAFCWCDGTKSGHEDGCPPNFVYDDFEVRWYKYLGRGMYVNYDKSPDGINSMLINCLNSLNEDSTNDK